VPSTSGLKSPCSRAIADALESFAGEAWPSRAYGSQRYRRRSRWSGTRPSVESRRAEGGPIRGRSTECHRRYRPHLELRRPPRAASDSCATQPPKTTSPRRRPGSSCRTSVAGRSATDWALR